MSMSEDQVKNFIMAAMLKRLGGHVEFTVEQMEEMQGWSIHSKIMPDMGVQIDLVPMTDKGGYGHGFN